MYYNYNPYNPYSTQYPDYLMHFGIPGMKWGVRRYQNKDGTLTNEGRKRYIPEDRKMTYKEFTKASRKFGGRIDRNMTDLSNRLFNQGSAHGMYASTVKKMDAKYGPEAKYLVATRRAGIRSDLSTGLSALGTLDAARALSKNFVADARYNKYAGAARAMGFDAPNRYTNMKTLGVVNGAIGAINVRNGIRSEKMRRRNYQKLYDEYSKAYDSGNLYYQPKKRKT